MFSVKVIFDILVICLLIPTIVYMVILNQRIKTLRGQKEDFLKLISVFNDVTAKAESSLLKIKDVGETSGKNLKELVGQASKLREDLAFMNDLAKNNVDNLEKLVRKVEFSLNSDKKSNDKNSRMYGVSENENNIATSSLFRNNRKSAVDESSDVATIMKAIKSAREVTSNIKDKTFGIRDGDDEHTEMEKGLLNDMFGLHMQKKGN